MHEITVETTFAAAHAIRIRGQLEPLHGHNWRVVAAVGASELDQDGLVCDFHQAHADLEEIVAPFRNRNLNELPPFSTGVNPTAELVAKHIADRLEAALPKATGRALRVLAVAVTEAPGCIATHRPG